MDTQKSFILFKSWQGLAFLLLSGFLISGCSEIHKGVYSYEEVYVANKGNDFEFTHFKFFGSDNVLILTGSEDNPKDFSGLCTIHKMNCQRIVMNINSDKAHNQLEKAWKEIQTFKGESFLLLSDNVNSTAAVVSKYAKAKYNESPEKLQSIFKALKVDQPEAVQQALEIP